MRKIAEHLKLLSEEVFDFSRGEMTQDKIEFEDEFECRVCDDSRVVRVCVDEFTETRVDLANAQTLHAFLTWIPLGYIFESPLLETLLRLFPNPTYRNGFCSVWRLQFGRDAHYDGNLKGLCIPS